MHNNESRNVQLKKTFPFQQFSIYVDKLKLND